MAERKSVTLIYKYHDNWIGGTYYIINIIKNLLILPDNERPAITICYEGPAESLDAIKNINYPYISYLKFNNWYNQIIRVLNGLTNVALKRKWLLKTIPQRKVKNLYPASLAWSLKNVDNLYLWIPDFQEKHLPHFFSAEQLESRHANHVQIKESALPIVFSSNTALHDYDTFYPGNTNPKTVLQFVTNIGDSYKSLAIDQLYAKFNLQQPYFIVSNQFWKHKNHMVVIKAAKFLRDKGLNVKIVFTGKEHDFRNPDYITDIKSFIADNGLTEAISFLGFIGRDEQLQLMKHAVAIIQPSLFEGWSTVVEDAKALNQFILLSDITLHREQIKQNCMFFDPYNEEDLATKIEILMQGSVIKEAIIYDNLIADFARNFLSLLK